MTEFTAGFVEMLQYTSHSCHIAVCCFLCIGELVFQGRNFSLQIVSAFAKHCTYATIRIIISVFNNFSIFV